MKRIKMKQTNQPLCTISSRPFGSIDEREATLWTLTNHNGMQIAIMDFGATITSIKLPAAKQLIECVLGFDHAEAYGSEYYLISTGGSWLHNIVMIMQLHLLYICSVLMVMKGIRAICMSGLTIPWPAIMNWKSTFVPNVIRIPYLIWPNIAILICH